ncbi:MFS transporter [Rhodococcus olei]|uniref:MFS transporter n=1 Tax=Rhodococcus olei TaxID=2161675 RepID=A0ABP8P9G1_9NOCA
MNNQPTEQYRHADDAGAVNRRRALWGSSLGTTLEWYDFFLYGSMAVIVFPHLFFSQQSGYVATLLSVSTFGAAFVVRPIGAALFGALGDRRGRREVLVTTMVLMGVSTALIGLLPTDQKVGLWAPFLLVLLRLLQGLSTGGEWGGATLMAVENAKHTATRAESRRGFYGSLVMAASPAGLVLSNAAILILTRIDKAAFMEWGWRIPFLAGGVIAVLGLVIRLGVTETEEFTKLADRGEVSSSPVRTVLRRFPLRMLRIACIYMGPGAAFYAVIIFGQKYAVQNGGLTAMQMSAVVVLYGITMFAGTVWSGHHVDRFGAARMGFYGIVAMGVMTPIVMAVMSSGNFGLVVVVYLVMAVVQAIVNAPLAVVFTDMFAPDVRYTGVSLGYQLGTIFGGALPPIIALWLLERTGSVWSVVAYLVALLVVSALCIVGLMNRSDESEVEPAGAVSNAMTS